MNRTIRQRERNAADEKDPSFYRRFFCVSSSRLYTSKWYTITFYFEVMLFIIRRLLNRLCSLLFCWQISAGGCVLI